MNEKIAVAVVVDAETAEKIAKEVKRETLRDELTAMLNRMEQEGFRLAISDHPEKCDPFFTDNIVINARYFNSRDRYASYVNKR
jgi:hypothetical protein